jgi:hypothetical protein
MRHIGHRPNNCRPIGLEVEIAATVDFDSLLGAGLAHVKEEAFARAVLRGSEFDRYPRFDCGIGGQEHLLPRLHCICNVIEDAAKAIRLDRHTEIVFDIGARHRGKDFEILARDPDKFVGSETEHLGEEGAGATSAELRLT